MNRNFLDTRYPFQLKGYNAWIEIWVAGDGKEPLPENCPAIYMQPGDDKNDFLFGWAVAAAQNKVTT